MKTDLVGYEVCTCRCKMKNELALVNEWGEIDEVPRCGMYEVWLCHMKCKALLCMKEIDKNGAQRKSSLRSE